MNIEQIQQRIQQAQQLHITANNQAKQTETECLDMSLYAGIIDYHPEELVMTVKAGTTLCDIENILADKGQTITFVSHRSDKITIGELYAIGSPEIRDAVLGIKIIDGQGQILSFGGQVMKNVAGYDVARLLVGSKGKLAAICEISFRVLPDAYAIAPSASITENKSQPSAIRERIELGLKHVFDPKGIFI